MNSNMQGQSENLLTSTDKMRALKEKLKVLSLRVKNKNFDKFSYFSETNNNEIVQLFIQHLDS